MEKEKPHGSNEIQNSELHAGGHIQQAGVINNYAAPAAPLPPRYLTVDVPNNADHILGRKDELEQIRQHLTEGKATVLVNGIGGIGKTSVATKYIATYGNEYSYIAWLVVRAGLPETFYNHPDLPDALHLKKEVSELVTAQQPIEAFRKILRRLNELENTLVVLDNANELADLVEYKPLFDNAKCHFLITSRRRPQEWTVVDIGILPKAEAVALFKKRAPDAVAEGATDEAIAALLERLFYHTLLIELVAKALSDADYSFADLQKMVTEKFIHDPALNDDIVPTGAHGDSVKENLKRATIENYIWLIFTEVKDLGEEARQVLRAMALLPLGGAYDRPFLKEHLAFFEINDIPTHLNLLAERGWLEKEKSPDNKTQFKIHPLIADVVEKHLEVNAEFAAGYIGKVANLTCYDAQDTTHNLFEINKNRPLADRLSDLYFEENTAAVGELLHSLGQLEENFGFYEKSTTIMERALKIVEAIYESEHAEIAKFQNTLGWTYQLLGRYDEAVNLFETSLESDLRNFGKTHERISDVQNNLGWTYNLLGRYEEAADLLETALASDLKNFGKDHPTVAVRQSNLANVYRDLGRYDKAAELLETALASDLKNFGKDHPEIAKKESNLALVYRNLGRYDKATELLETALSSDLKNFGKDHPTVAVRQSNLALVYRSLGRYDKAAELLETALASAEKNLGKDHPAVAVRQWNLAAVYIATGKKVEAKALLQSAYENFLKNFGPDHPSTINIQTWFPKAES